jgi:hypothetical protein
MGARFRWRHWIAAALAMGCVVLSLPAGAFSRPESDARRAPFAWDAADPPETRWVLPECAWAWRLVVRPARLGVTAPASVRAAALAPDAAAQSGRPRPPAFCRRRAPPAMVA